MPQTYQGYFQEGRFVSSDMISIPENTRVYITVVGDEPDTPQRQHEALKRFFASIDAIDGEPLSDDDFADLEKMRVKLC